ncbi:peroxidase superfamily protein [Tanacetum coccineum]
MELSMWLRNIVHQNVDGIDRPDHVDLALLDIYRDMERNVARYNEFRRSILLIPISRWEDLTDNQEAIETLRKWSGTGEPIVICDEIGTGLGGFGCRSGGGNGCVWTLKWVRLGAEVGAEGLKWGWEWVCADAETDKGCYARVTLDSGKAEMVCIAVLQTWVHPLQPDRYEEFYARAMDKTTITYEAEVTRSPWCPACGKEGNLSRGADIAKITRKRTKPGQTRTRERKSTQKAERKLSKSNFSQLGQPKSKSQEDKNLKKVNTEMVTVDLWQGGDLPAGDSGGGGWWFGVVGDGSRGDSEVRREDEMML